MLEVQKPAETMSRAGRPRALTPAQAAEALKMREGGVPLHRICAKFDASQTAVRDHIARARAEREINH